jgi:uncharacterized protein
VSGSLDLDKMEYLRRDARFCGVPYGEVDVDRLLQGLVLLRDPETGRLEVGIQEKALSALESLLFAKYQMFRNVYWHHAVRAATALYKRIVSRRWRWVSSARGSWWVPPMRSSSTRSGAGPWRRTPPWAPVGGAMDPGPPVPAPPEAGPGAHSPGVGGSGATALGGRGHPGAEGGGGQPGGDPGPGTGEVFLDFPAKRRMLELDLLVQRRGEGVERLREGGLPGLLDLPAVAEELYRTTRVLRVFTLEPRTLEPEVVLPLLASGGRGVGGGGGRGRDALPRVRNSCDMGG